MKKIVMVLLISAFAFCLVACNPEEETFKVGFIYIGHANDGGYSQATDNGRKYLEENVDGVKTYYVENVPEDETFKTKAEELIDQGCKVIVANSFGYMEFIASMCKDYKDVKFLHCSGYMSDENFSNYFGRMYQARYISGVIAGMKLNELGTTNIYNGEGLIGYVAAMPIPEVIRGINAFTLGVQSVCSTAKVKVTFTNTWYDPTVEKNAAIALLDEGADIIAQHQDTPQPQIAAQEKGKFSVGYNMNMNLNETSQEAHLVSAVWNWGPLFVEQVESIMDNTWTNAPYWKGLEVGVVDVTGVGKNAPEGTQEKINELKNDFINEGFDVFKNKSIKDQNNVEKVTSSTALTDSELLSMMWFVQGVIGTIPSEE